MNSTALGARIKVVVENFTQEIFYGRKTQEDIGNVENQINGYQEGH